MHGQHGEEIRADPRAAAEIRLPQWGTRMTKILVVDDDQHIRELVSVFLRKAGFEIHEACDGVEALSNLDTVKVDLVILDIMMPNLEGSYAGS